MSRVTSNAEDLSFLISFINIVEQHPCLWNHKAKDYHKTDVISLAWKNIAGELKDTEQNCRERWKNIRCAFVRSLKPPAFGSDRKVKKSYYLAQHLAFLIPYTKGNSMPDKLNALTDSEQNETQIAHENCEPDPLGDVVTSVQDQPPKDMSSQLIELPPQKKRKLVSLPPQTSDATDIDFVEWVKMKKPNQNKQEDSDLLFFRSLLPDLNKLNDRGKRIFKSKMMTTLYDMLDEVEQDASSTPKSTTSIESTSSWVIPVNPSHILR